MKHPSQEANKSTRESMKPIKEAKVEDEAEKQKMEDDELVQKAKE